MTEKLSGRELPYALLQYVWANTIPVGTVLENPYTRRVRMLVVASGADGVGRWQSLVAQPARRFPPRVPGRAGAPHRHSAC
jgi:hypothetical protein